MTAQLCDWCDSPATSKRVDEWHNEYGQRVRWTERACPAHRFYLKAPYVASDDAREFPQLTLEMLA